MKRTTHTITERLAWRWGWFTMSVGFLAGMAFTIAIIEIYTR